MKRWMTSLGALVRELGRIPEYNAEGERLQRKMRAWRGPEMGRRQVAAADDLPVVRHRRERVWIIRAFSIGL